mmetsp:Transcript_22827/g.32186  ORF Transcript_22827/g.32186 Transcript_22827/m.32186 type:complete len:312 (+) Transcript_22827:375-1310(+)|eukprot:CAMPEP_0184862666 /NCGR_PEP_ID=MMETSP0580-20130426/7089_1 /TAXON_ID=1118495 /ORGANISM="Dactyliosolen fragilissimus" /LENGTH=311 /DNA_ID=CAMNT_0027360619 /DNA_START=107 /DNA_END=1042 /DNA_ORIENTATION=-
MWTHNNKSLLLCLLLQTSNVTNGFVIQKQHSFSSFSPNHHSQRKQQFSSIQSSSIIVSCDNHNNYYNPNEKNNKKKKRYSRSNPLYMSSTEEREDDTASSSSSSEKNSMQFDDAVQALKDQEDEARMEARGNMFDEEQKSFDAKKDSMEEMRAKIRARAADLNVEKSVATAEAIKQATQRAKAGEDLAAAEATLDLSKFGNDLLDNPEDELTEEQRMEIDSVGQLPVWEQALEEFRNTKFPSAEATIKQAGLMVLIFVVTASLILKVDDLLRVLYTGWGFIPPSGEIPDFSDLALPDGWTDQMTDADLANM